MLFSRRDRVKLGSRLRTWVWPHRGWRRATTYHWHRVARISETPRRIAMGFACGVFISFTPILGFHIIFAALLALMLNGSVIASAAGTLVGNPLTFPLIWLGSYNLGAFLLGEVPSKLHVITWPPDTSVAVSTFYTGTWTELWYLVEPVVLPMSVGGVLLGLGFGVLIYYMMYFAIDAYQRRRREIRARGAAAIVHPTVTDGDV